MHQRSHPSTALRSLIGILFVLLLPISPFCLAAPVTQLYSAEVPVSGQEASERNQAIREAFGKVLVKVTGNPRIASRPELGSLIKQAQRYIQQYRYRIPDRFDDGVEASAGEEGRLLWVQFDKREIDRLLRANRLPVWGDNRPLVLIWLATETNGKRGVVLPDMFPSLTESINTAAGDRGIPVIFPLMDLEDQDNLPVSDLWGGFGASIARASERYRPDVILIGRISNLGRKLWRANWSLTQGEKETSWSGQAKNLHRIGVEAIQQTADRLADQYAPAGGATEVSTTLVTVGAVRDLTDHTAVLEYLKSRGSIESIETVRVEPDAATFRLVYRGVLQTLERELELGGLLYPDPEVPLEPASPPGMTLFYRLRE